MEWFPATISHHQAILRVRRDERGNAQKARIGEQGCYLCHDAPHFSDFLSPHEDQFVKIFGVTSVDVICGIERIIGRFPKWSVVPFLWQECFPCVLEETVRQKWLINGALVAGLSV